MNEDESIDAIIDAVLGGVIINVLCSSRKSFYLGGWNLHKMEVLNRHIVRNYIRFYINKERQPNRLKIPCYKMIRRPKKPK